MCCHRWSFFVVGQRLNAHKTNPPPHSICVNFGRRVWQRLGRSAVCLWQTQDHRRPVRRHSQVGISVPYIHSLARSRKTPSRELPNSLGEPVLTFSLHPRPPSSPLGIYLFIYLFGRHTLLRVTRAERRPVALATDTTTDCSSCLFPRSASAEQCGVGRHRVSGRQVMPVGWPTSRG